MPINKKVAVLVAGATLAVGAATVAASPALASVSGDYATSGVAIRSAPNTGSSTILGRGYPGQGATIYCMKLGTNVNGNPLWAYHKNQSTAKIGYSADYYMSWSGTVYSC